MVGIVGQRGILRMMQGGLHECMGKPNFGSVDGAISSGFDDGKDTCVVWIKNDFIYSLLAEWSV